MKATEKLIYTNANGESVELSFFSVYTVTKYTDYDLENEMTTTKTNLQDGETVTGSALSPRSISVEGYYKLTESNQLERQLKRVMNPKLPGTLVYRDTEVERYIDVMLEAVPEIQRKPGRAEFSLDFIAHNPYWREWEKTEYIALLTPELRFPFIVPQRKGVIFGKRKPFLETEVVNVGDAETGFRVVFKAKGPVKNPSVIHKETGEQIKILVNMERGDTVEVKNHPYDKQIYLNGDKAFRLLDRRNSQFFTLHVGRNLIGYQADLNTVNLDVIIYYYPLYL